MRLLPLLVALPACSVLPADSVPRTVSAAVDAEGLWVLQLRRQEWRPRDLEFVLQVEADGTGSASLDPVFHSRTDAELKALSETADGQLTFTLAPARSTDDYFFEGTRQGDTLEGLVHWHDGNRDQVDPFIGFRRQVRRHDDSLTVPGLSKVDDPRSVGLSPVLVDRLVLGAENSRSDAVLIASEGRLVAGRLFGGEDRSMPFLGASHSGWARPSEALLAGMQHAATDLALTEGSDNPWTVRTDGWSAGLNVPGRVPADGHGEVGALVEDNGQFLAVYPDADVVVVRMHRRHESRYDARYDSRDGFEWLPNMADALALDKLDHATP